ncbi:lipase 3-like [Cylas formicarius]|uniref:lipase 3-like n=1 Tax=Cylas formicarius TaxID=197179 RepID=UPI002958CFD1|nr:lipase 3-like [Cylas formicarius]
MQTNIAKSTMGVIFFMCFSIIFGTTHGAAIENVNVDADIYQNVLIEINKLKDSNGSVEYLIETDEYPVETHTVTTKDGYILKMHRIPNGKKRKSNGKVAFLQHGILSSSADWVIMGPDRALAYMLADEGYDVWLGNARGNTQSRAHVSYDPDKDSKFWQFSWHEIGTIDVPLMIDYVLNNTGVDGVYYVGHSQGTTVFYVMTSILPEYNSKIKAQISLAPIGFMNHMTSPLLKLVALFQLPLEMLLKLIGVDEFLPASDFTKNVLGDAVCAEDAISQLLCTNALFAVCGFSRSQMNSTLLPIMMKYTPAGAATNQILHYGQEITSGKFRQYDLGLLSNLRVYGSIFPPDYNLSKITSPVYLIYSRNDWLSAEKDVNRICNGMKDACKAMLLMSDFSFNHLDYMFGIDAPSLVYNKVISLFTRH